MDGDNFLLDKKRQMRCIHAISRGPFTVKDLPNLEICALLSSSKQTIKGESIFVNGFDKFKPISENNFNIVL